MEKTTILVTGATGYVGSALIKALFENFQPEDIHLKAFVRKTSDRSLLKELPIDWVEGDITDVESLQRATTDVDIIFHTAALISYQRLDRRKLFQINVQGTRNLVNVALENQVKRLIFTSSVAAVGVNSSEKPADESTVFLPWQHRIGYMDSKYLSELEVFRGIAEGLDAVILNPGVIIGHYPGLNALSKASTALIRDIYKGKIPYYPNGGVGFVDITDVVEAHINAMKEGKTGECYNIVSENLTYHNFFNCITSLKGSRRNTVLPLPKAFGIAIGLIAELVGFVFQRTSPIAVDNIFLSNKCLFYANQKSIDELNINYTPIKTSLEKLLHSKAV